MDFDQVRTFLEVAKLGSFSRAGHKVFRSQSAVSGQIRQLEEEYGEKLLDRSGKTVRLTPAGEVFREYARRLVAVRDESLRAVADQGLDYATLKKMTRTSLEHAFLPGTSLWSDARKFTPVHECAGERPSSVPNAACTKFLNSSEKAREQWRLERRLAEFESKF